MAKAKDEVAKKTLKATVTQNEHILIRLAANLQGKSIGVYVKEIVLAQADKDLKAGGVDTEKVKLPDPTR